MTTNARIEPIEIGANFPVTLEMLQDQRNGIRDHFYVTQLQLIDARKMTAAEARIRTAENARVLGPTFGRLNDDYLDRLIERTLGILRRAGKLAPIPQVVLDDVEKRGTQLRVRFVSPLARAQVASEVQGIQQTAATAFAWAEQSGNPAVIDNIDLDFGIKKIADLDGTPAGFLRDDDLVKKMRDTRAKDAELRKKLEAAQLAGKAGKDFGAAGEPIATFFV